jgi:hypothetical protein
MVPLAAAAGFDFRINGSCCSHCHLRHWCDFVQGLGRSRRCGCDEELGQLALIDGGKFNLGDVLGAHLGCGSGSCIKSALCRCALLDFEGGVTQIRRTEQIHVIAQRDIVGYSVHIRPDRLFRGHIFFPFALDFLSA